MNFLNFDLKKALSVMIILLLPLISINMQRKPFVQIWYNKPFSFLASVTQSSFFSFSDGVRGNTQMYLNLIGIKRENQNLKSENQRLMAMIQAQEELGKENERLNQLINFKNHSKMDLVAARVMSKDLLSDHNTLQISKGTVHGIKAGQAVITVSGVVGYIFKPESFSAQVLLITDRYSVVDGIIARSRARGIVEGKNASTCLLRYLEKSEDIQVGDLVVTSGLDNIFPKGFPVATVESIENKNYAISAQVELRPVVDSNKVEEVFVIVNAANEDLSEKVAGAKE